VLTVSDRVSRSLAEDRSGPEACRMAAAIPGESLALTRWCCLKMHSHPSCAHTRLHTHTHSARAHRAHTYHTTRVTDAPARVLCLTRCRNIGGEDHDGGGA
jgi:hypothetical protein